jgi:origin recognition complex subunit 2
MEAGMSILCYGWGSKRRLLDGFSKVLSKAGHRSMSVYGFKPNIDSTRIIFKVAKYILGLDNVNFSVSELLRKLSEPNILHNQLLFIILHNIDGIGLRTKYHQDMLSQLITSTNIRIIASFDHMDTPIIWNRSLILKYRWIYYYIPTYENYLHELRHMTIRSKTIGKNKTTLGGTFQALKQLPSAKMKTLSLLIEFTNTKKYKDGITFESLLSLCRANWILSRTDTLKNIIQELLDQDIVEKRWKHQTKLFYSLVKKKSAQKNFIKQLNSLNLS